MPVAFFTFCNFSLSKISLIISETVSSTFSPVSLSIAIKDEFQSLDNCFPLSINDGEAAAWDAWVQQIKIGGGANGELGSTSKSSNFVE